MIYKATKAIEAALKNAELKYSIKETEKSSAVRIGWEGDSHSVTLFFISHDDDTDVAVCITDWISVPESKRESILTTLNALNNEYRYFKFCLHDDGDIAVEYDFPVSIAMDQVGDTAMEMIARSLKILEDAYPKLMKAIWA